MPLELLGRFHEIILVKFSVKECLAYSNCSTYFSSCYCCSYHVHGEDRSLAHSCHEGCDMGYGTGLGNIIVGREDVKGRLPGGGDTRAGF